MEKEFIHYEQSLALKELGFDEPCLMYWNDFGKTSINRFQLHNKIDEWCQNYIEAPLYQQAFRWFREKYGLDYSINPFYYPETTKIRFRWDYFKFIYHEVPNRRKFESFGGGEATREEAELECLKKLIEIVKTKK
jgi:hypothetical protein